MARRKREEERDNHERWLVSYADFITLLFAFFVVMYALSTVNEGKYRILSESMVSAFRNVQVNAASAVPVIVTPPIPEVQKQSDAATAARQDEKCRQGHSAGHGATDRPREGPGA
jgi:chemotaxis protein MotB